MDLLGESLQTAQHRLPFLEALQSRFESLKDQFDEMREANITDEHWQLWFDNVSEVGQILYGKTRQSRLTDQEKEMSRDPRPLLQQLRQAREELRRCGEEYGHLLNVDGALPACLAISASDQSPRRHHSEPIRTYRLALPGLPAAESRQQPCARQCTRAKAGGLETGRRPTSPP